ncbi:MAG: hypothetical protein AAB368_10880, partial [bacterium]
FPPREKLDRAGIRGVFFDAARASSFACADPTARLEIVMQSSDNWWMVLGSVPLAKITEAWSTFSLPVKEPRHLAAVGNAFNLRIAVYSANPLAGALLLDRAGLLVR